MIVPAKKSEIPEIVSLTRACAQDMITKNIFQWNEHYPTAAAFEQDIERNELYVFKKNQKIISTIVLSSLMDDEYLEVNWLTPSTNNLYIHRLAVHPDFQRRGIARTMMDYAYAFAQASNAPSIRLDTFSQNKRNHTFYETRGYKRLGNIFFPVQSEDPFYCYERVL